MQVYGLLSLRPANDSKSSASAEPAASEQSLAGRLLVASDEHALLSNDQKSAMEELLRCAKENSSAEAIELLVNLAAGVASEALTSAAGKALVALCTDLLTPPHVRSEVAYSCKAVVETVTASPWDYEKLSPVLVYMAAVELAPNPEAEKDMDPSPKLIEIMETSLGGAALKDAAIGTKPDDLAKAVLKRDRYVTEKEFVPAAKASSMTLFEPQSHAIYAIDSRELADTFAGLRQEDFPVPIMVNFKNHWVLLIACSDTNGNAACIAFDSLEDEHGADDVNRRESILKVSVGEARLEYINKRFQNLHPGRLVPAPLDNACGPFCTLALRAVSRGITDIQDKSFEAISRYLNEWTKNWSRLDEAQQTRIVAAERAGMLASLKPDVENRPK